MMTFQYSTGSWRNRNRLKTPIGLQWITVPVRFHFGERIEDVEIGRTTGIPWRQRHRRQLSEALGKAPYFGLAIDLWEACAARSHERLTDLNVDLITTLSKFLEISTPIVRSSRYQVSGTKTERLICLLERSVQRTTSPDQVRRAISTKAVSATQAFVSSTRAMTTRSIRSSGGLLTGPLLCWT